MTTSKLRSLEAPVAVQYHYPSFYIATDKCHLSCVLMQLGRYHKPIRTIPSLYKRSSNDYRLIQHQN